MRYNASVANECIMPSITNNRLFHVVNGWIRFRFSYKDKRITFHPHIQEDEITIAQAIEQIIRNDIALDTFDESLERYRIKKDGDNPSLWDTWQLWLNEIDEVKTNATAKKRRLTTDWVARFKYDKRPIHQVFDALEKLLKENTSVSYAEQILKQVRRAVLDVEGIRLDVSVTTKVNKGIIDVFPKKELQNLLSLMNEQEFLSNDDKAFIMIMAFTGMRPSEICALDCCHWNQEENTLLIERAFDGKDIKPTKNLKTRIIKVSPVLTDILHKQSLGKAPNQPIVQGLRSFRYPYSEFVRSVWKPLLRLAVDKKIIHHYRNPYQLRHTFASIALAKGRSLEELGAHLGNSPRVCRQHYAGYQPSDIVLDF